MDIIKDLTTGGALFLALIPPDAVDVVGVLPIPKTSRELADLLAYFALFLFLRLAERWRARKRRRTALRKVKAALPPIEDEYAHPLSK